MAAAERVELAVALYERDVLSRGLAAKAAGMSYSQMIDEWAAAGYPPCDTASRISNASLPMPAPLLAADSGP
jgi:Uncharacterised protein family (UPF0175)